jgi:hypothetical protein
MDEHVPDGVIEYWLYEHGGDDPAANAAYNRVMFAEFVRNPDRWGVSIQALAAKAGTAWSYGGDTCLSREEWRYLFKIAGYRETDSPAERPSQPLSLWRGATPEHRSNWSWTTRRDTAIHFASGWSVQTEIGLVWRAVVEPDRLLAKVTFAGEDEYVVDTEGLTIEPDGLWCRCAVDMAPFRGDVHRSRTALDIHELVLCPRL